MSDSLSSFAPGHLDLDNLALNHQHQEHQDQQDPRRSPITRPLTTPPRILIPATAVHKHSTASSSAAASPSSAVSSIASSIPSPSSASMTSPALVQQQNRASLGHPLPPHRHALQQRQSYHGRAAVVAPSRLGNNNSNNESHSTIVSRTPRRDSSLPFPLPAILPALPPLIPVSSSSSSPANSPLPSSSTSARLPASVSSPPTPILSAETEVAQLVTPRPHHQRLQQHKQQNEIGEAHHSSNNNRESTDDSNTHKGEGSSGTVAGTTDARSLAPGSASGLESEHGPGLAQEVSVSLSSSSSASAAVSLPTSELNHHPHPHPHQQQDQQTGSLPSTPTTLVHQQQQGEQWPESPRHFLDRIKETVSKAELGNLLSKGTDAFHQAVLRTHMESFDFRRDPIDLALRKFLLDFHFPKEAQQIDRVLEAFAGRYHGCNPHLFRSADVVYTLAFSLMLLHTDAHNKNVRYKMTREQYVRQAKSIDGVNTIPADILEVLYDNITYLKFVYAEDEMDVDGQRLADVQPPPSSSWFPRRRTASSQRIDSYNMIRQGSIAHLAPDLSDLIPFRWPYYWKGTIEMVDNVQINNQFTRAPIAYVPGLRSRRHSQNCTHPTSGRPLVGLGVSGASVHPETIMQSGECNAGGGGGAISYDDAGMDGAAELKLAKFGILSRKIDLEHGRKSSVRGWRDLGVILSGSQLLFFTELAWFQQQRAALPGFDPRAPPEIDGYFAPTQLGGGPPPMPQALISTMNSIAVVDSGYQKYPHVFRLICPNGKQYLFRADSEHEMNDWMARINYASAFKTAGVRLRSYRVAWASDVIWIKDEQGRHQLRRKSPPKDQSIETTTVAEPIDGRTQLIQVKMKDIDREINACSASLAAELRLARGLEVMIPLQTVTRQRIVQSATLVGKRLRHLMLERTKLDCFRTILERDLALVPSNCYIPDDRYRQVYTRGGPLPSDCMSGTTQYSRSLSSGPTTAAATDDHRDLAREEYVLDSTRTSSSSLYSGKGLARPRLHVPEFHRTVSETVLDDQRRALRAVRDTDIPQGPVAIQAAIIEAARGGHAQSGVGVSSTLSSPDPSRYQESNFDNHHRDKSPRNKGQGQGQGQLSPMPTSPSSTFLSPDSPATGSAVPMSRSRALSMPGERPNRMPRTVSIYSSSSQTANKLKRLFEQGLGHLKWGTPGSSSSSFPVPPVPVPSSLSSGTTFDPQESGNSAAEVKRVVRLVSIGPPSPQTDDYTKLSTGAHQDIIRKSHPSQSVSFAEDVDAPVLGTEKSKESFVARSSVEEPAFTAPEPALIISLPIEAADVDNGEDDVVMDRTHVPRVENPSFSSSTSFEQSFVMMVSSDYVTETDDNDDQDLLGGDPELDGSGQGDEGEEGHDDDDHEQDENDYKEAGLHEEYKAARLLTSDLSLSLSLDMPALSTMLDNEDAWHTIP
ncbi:hypothetical protein BGZ83_009317 [Gryganskiella cystojenkinii]|nr:hypothetical protein BGZ83_009317 [Gryganskiella cystojenkinii]